MTNLINQVLLFKKNNGDYTEEEKTLIKKGIDYSCNKRIKKYMDSFVKAIDFINNL